MADEQAKSADTNKPKITKHRSPNYPFINLRDAIERLQVVNEFGRGHFISIGTARNAWGYQQNAGDRTAAALKAYGLIEVQGSGEKREIKPTEAGAKILEYHSQRAELLKEAALSPEIHREIWTKYAGKLPADIVIREYLRWEKAFNPENINKFLQQFRETITFANLSESDKIEPNEAVANPPAGDQKKMEPTSQTPQIANRPAAPLVFQDTHISYEPEDMLSFNLSRTGKAQIRFNGQVTQEAIKKLVALLNLSVDTYPTEAELIRPKRAMWRNKDHDQPVTVIGRLGEKDGREFYAIEESETGIPENELEFEE